VLLGDYIDRGPESAGVIDWILAAGLPASYVALRGNHEETLLNFLDDEEVLEDWRRFGGLETLVSYGIDVKDVMRGKGYADAQSALRERLPRSIGAFMRKPNCAGVRGIILLPCRRKIPCSAGATGRARFAVDREEFNDFSGAFEKIIVHGHTPVSAPGGACKSH